MKDKIYISCGDYADDGQFYHDVTIKGEEFKNVPNIPKCEHCDSDNCEYYRDCMDENGGVVRTFDCEKNKIIVSRIWNMLTGMLVWCLSFTYYKTWSLGFFKGTAALIASLVVLDIICCGIEKLVSIFRDKYFYHKLKNREKKEKAKKEQERLAEEAKRIQEQAEADAKDPNRVKIRNAETTLDQIEQLSEEIDFGECDEQVEFCIAKCREIIDYLKNNSSGYIRVSSLLEVQLPAFHETLAYYAEFENADAVEDAYGKTLNDTVNYFYNFLCNQKVEAIFDKRATEIKFNAAANVLMREIKNRGGKL